jgi:hypothetical protein
MSGVRDVINSTPTIVGAPRERFDILYGDQDTRDSLSGGSPTAGRHVARTTGCSTP